nr:MAG TPA: hypothetical protein [Caudoviricetes sp.]
MWTLISQGYSVDKLVINTMWVCLTAYPIFYTL